MNRSSAIGLIASLVCVSAQALAADLPRHSYAPRHYHARRHAALPPVDTGKHVDVVVDQLSLSNGCPNDPRCIAPRILPIVGHGEARDRVYRIISVPVDPRYESRY